MPKLNKKKKKKNEKKTHMPRREIEFPTRVEKKHSQQ